MNFTPPPIPGQTTPPPPPIPEQQLATIDPRFYGSARTADKIARDMIEAEMAKYTSEEPDKVTTTPIEKKKNIIIGISAAISLICIVLSQFFHWGMCTTAIVVIINLIICKMFTGSMNLMSKLISEAKNRPDESIENIVANASVEFCKSKGLLRTGAYVGLVGLLPAGMFSQSHIFYETAPDGKYVRYYMDGIIGGETDIVIPETVDGMVVKGIRGDAFMETNITSITLPNTIDTIRGHAFEGCANLRQINLPQNLKYIGGYAFSGCENLGEIEFPEGLTLISGYAFSGCKNLEFSKLPQSLDSIGGYAFQDCRNLTEIEMGNSVKRIGGGAFQNCQILHRITLSESLTEIHGETFQNCENLYSITIPDGVGRIGGSAFRNCYNLSKVELPNSIAEIGSSAFRNCRNLNEIEIPMGCVVNERAFKDSPTHIYEK